MAAIEVINDQTGERTRMSPKRFAAVADRGWRPVTDADNAPPDGGTADDTVIDVVKIRRDAILAEVAGDADKAIAAYAAETDLVEPDTELLDALQAVADGTSNNTDPASQED